jgi:hypothetical protein
VRTAAKVALTNGVVDATIRHDGITEHVSTEQFPVAETVKYNPKTESRYMVTPRCGKDHCTIEEIEGGPCHAQKQRLRANTRISSAI